MVNQMTRLLFCSILMLFTDYCFAQLMENIWQPDSVYALRKVKKIRVSETTRNNIDQIVEFDEHGKRIRIEEYEYSFYYKLGSQKYKKYIDRTSYYHYDVEGKLIRIVHSTIDSVSKSRAGLRTFDYDSTGLLYKSKVFTGVSGKPDFETEYFYNPYKIISTTRDDSIITFQAISEFDKDFYLNHYYGYQFQQKEKWNAFNQLDSCYLVKVGLESTINNSFDSSGRLNYSDYIIIWKNDDKFVKQNEFRLRYHYYKNGLLKRIGRYDLFYKYEYYK